MTMRIVLRALCIAGLLSLAAVVPACRSFIAQDHQDKSDESRDKGRENDETDKTGKSDDDNDKDGEDTAEADSAVAPLRVRMPGMSEQEPPEFSAEELEELPQAKIEAREAYTSERWMKWHELVLASGRRIKHGVEYVRTVSGVKISESEYVLGKEDGVSIHWYEDGARESRREYRSGVMVGRAMKWHRNGMPEEDRRYHTDGLPTGRYCSWHDNGRARLTGEYANGRREGLWREWDRDGNLLSETTYKDGEKAGESKD